MSRTQNPVAFLDNIEINYGPLDLLGGYFLHIAENARQMGVTLHMARGFDRLIEINRLNQETWHPLVPLLVPAVSGVGPEDAIYIEGRSIGTGEPVMTMALRKFDWPDTSLKAEFESGRMFYRDPASQRGPDEVLIADAPMAAEIAGCAVYSGGVWCRRDFRKAGLAYISGELGIALALTIWNADYLFGLVEVDLADKGMMAKYNAQGAQSGLVVKNGFRPHVDIVLGWGTRQFLIDWMEAYRSTRRTTLDKVLATTKTSPPAALKGSTSRS